MSLTQSVDTDLVDNFQTPKADTPTLSLTPSEQITSSIPKLDLTPLQQIKKLKDNFKKICVIPLLRAPRQPQILPKMKILEKLGTKIRTF